MTMTITTSSGILISHQLLSVESQDEAQAGVATPAFRARQALGTTMPQDSDTKWRCDRFADASEFINHRPVMVC